MDNVKYLRRIMTLRDEFRKRSRVRQLQGYLFLGVSAAIVIGLFLVVNMRLLNLHGLRNSIQTSNDRLTEMIEAHKDSTLAQDTLKAMSRTELHELRNNNVVLLGALKDHDNATLVTNSLSIVLVLTIGFFLVQVFLKLYRYNMSMSNFYLTLADSFTILATERGNLGGMKFDALVNTLLPKGIVLETPEMNNVVDLGTIFSSKTKPPM